MLDLPMETSFSHQTRLQSSQVKNPIIGRILVGNPDHRFYKCFPNRDVIISWNPPNSYDSNSGTYVWIGGLLREK